MPTLSTFQNQFLMIGALLGFLGVAGGAFGAHFLRSKLSPEFLQTFEIGIRYQLYHALVLISLAVLTVFLPSQWFTAAGWFFVIGIFIFSGSLYLLVFSGVKAWGAVTPIGGLLLLIGWLNLFLGSFFSRS
jgi:uncharacterized membrane protein YgdD (TMEM256/DUF423 family)